MAYQGYGQSAQPAPQSYGQFHNSGGDYSKDHEKHNKYPNGGEDSMCRCFFKEGSAWAKIDNWCILFAAFGGLFCLISTFVPMWRYDPHGTSAISQTWYYEGFPSRGYGVIHVRGSWSQSWTTIAQAACDVRNLGQIAGIGEAFVNLVSSPFTGGCDDGKPGLCCTKSTDCQQAFASNMHVRCTEYQTLMRISMVTLMGTFLAFVLIVAGTLITAMSKRRRSGGIAFGLYLFAGILLAILNLAWALVSDNAFKNLGHAAWYPYPSLSVCFYMHTAGYSMILTSCAVFGYIVLPEVWNFDPAQEKLDKKKAKIEKRMAKEAAYTAKKQELQAVMQQQQNQPVAFPAQPGYGQPQPQMGYGQAYPQPQQPQPVPMPYQQAAPLGFQSDQGATYGQGGAAPAASPGDFGLGTAGGGPPPVAGPGDFGVSSPPTSGGYGAAAPAAGGYGAGGYGAAAPAAGGYGAPAAGGSGGFGVPAPAGYGAQQGRPNPPPKGYNWPAHSGAAEPQPVGDGWNSMPGPPQQV